MKKKDLLDQKLEIGAPISLDEGYEVLRRKQELNKETREAQKNKDFRINYSSPENVPQEKQQQYLVQVTNFLKKEHPVYYYILRLRMEGCTYEFISKNLSRTLNSNITVKQVKSKEFEAIKCVRDRIKHIKKVGIPIFAEQKV